MGTDPKIRRRLGVASIAALGGLVLTLLWTDVPGDTQGMYWLEQCRSDVVQRVCSANPPTTESPACEVRWPAWVTVEPGVEGSHAVTVRWLDWRHADIETRVRVVDPEVVCTGR
jgi:hypothetical protein